MVIFIYLLEKDLGIQYFFVTLQLIAGLSLLRRVKSYGHIYQ